MAFSPDGKLVAQTFDWLHLYERDRDRWRPKANRYLPVLWPGTLRPSSELTDCNTCVEVARDVPENLLELARINFDDYPDPPTKGDPQQLVSEWSTKLALTLDARGRIVPAATTPAR